MPYINYGKFAWKLYISIFEFLRWGFAYFIYVM